MTRPLGAYVRFGKELQDLSGAVLVPVADEKAFLALLDNVGMNPSKGKDGIYTLQTKQNIDLYLRFAKHYAYISGINTENLSDKKLLDPAKVLAGSADSVVTATVRLDQIDDTTKLIVLDQIAQAVQAQQEKALPGETPAQKEFRKLMLGQVGKTITDVFKEGQRKLRHCPAEGEKGIALRLSLAAQPGTDLAKSIAAAGKAKSLFAGLLPQDAAFRVLVDATLPPAMHKAFTKTMEDAAERRLPASATRRSATGPGGRQCDIADGQRGPSRRLLRHGRSGGQALHAAGCHQGRQWRRAGQRGPQAAGERGEEPARRATAKDQARRCVGWFGQDPPVRAAARRQDRHGARRPAGRPEPVRRIS